MEVNMSASSRQPTGFLDLPLEIRLQIYRYCLVRSNPVHVHYIYIDPYRFCDMGIHDEKKSLLLVSKEVGTEALEILYGDNVFQVCLHGGAGGYLRKNFTEANRRKIRIMQVLMQPHGIDYGRMLDSTIFPPVLANLKKLSIVAQQPLQAGGYYNAPTFEQDMEEWIGWLRATLQFITCHLPDRCIVQVDDDDKMETSAVMGECFPSGYRRVQTLAGDLCFERNDYSRESGYWDDDYNDHDVDSNAS